MQKFLNYLNSKRIVPKKNSHFYVIWVSKFIKFLNNKPVEKADDDDINHFINKLTKTYKQWQVDQAAEAVRIYLFYIKNKGKTPVTQSKDIDKQWKGVADEMRNMLRLKQLMRETEKTYMYWLRDFYRFLKGESPYLNDADLQLAAQKQEAYLKNANGHNLGTIHDFRAKKG